MAFGIGSIGFPEKLRDFHTLSGKNRDLGNILRIIKQNTFSFPICYFITRKLIYCLSEFSKNMGEMEDKIGQFSPQTGTAASRGFSETSSVGDVSFKTARASNISSNSSYSGSISKLVSSSLASPSV